MRQRMRRNYAKNCVQKKAIKNKNSEPGFEPGISNLQSATLTTQLPGLPYEKEKKIYYINTAMHFWRNFRAMFAQFLRMHRRMRENRAKQLAFFANLTLEFFL